MSKKMINECHIEGFLYNHTLKEKVTGETSKNPGTQYITGEVEIATDNNLTNVVKVHFTYVTAITKSKQPNATYTTLKNIIDGKLKSIMGDGIENAAKLRIDTAIGLREFYSDRNGNEELVSVKRNEGGFVHNASLLNEDENKRNTFKTDMVITNVVHVEADEETSTPEKGIVKGFVFNFRKDLLPVQFTVLNPNAISYFESLEASPNTPVFTQVWGRQVSQTTVKQTITKSAFGEDDVKETVTSQKDFVITGALADTYIWDDESTILASEFQTALNEREITLATLKKNADEYKAKKAETANVSAAAPAAGVFNF
jgi:hypothetical protein